MMSKRAKLFLVNIIAFILLFCCYMFDWVINGRLPNEITLQYLLIMCVFTFCSLIVYYLSIIADALKRPRADKMDSDRQPKQ